MKEAEIATKLMEMATEEELILFDKIYRSTEDKVLNELGYEKHKTIEVFMKNWAIRAIERA